MKTLIIVLSFFSFNLFSNTSAIANNKWATNVWQAKETLKEINAKNLPEEVTFDITENHNGATIVKAYETYIDGKKTGYRVEIKKVNREASLTYDLKGNPVNRITPVKM